MKSELFWVFSLSIIAVRGNIHPTSKRVCIIGAGVSGLVSADHFSKNLRDFEPIVFEKNSDSGGLWIYTDHTDLDDHGLPVHSSMYKYLRTNGPKQFMSFPDYPEFHGENRSYVRHETVLEYLRNYTDHFHLRRFIRFNTNVEKVSLKANNKWHIQLRNLNTNLRYVTLCDAVMVATGNFHTPYIPDIPGIETYRGRVLHSHTYRNPEEFANQTVVVLGASESGIDISLDLSHHATTIYLSHRHDKLKFELPSNIIQVPGVVEADGSELILSNGSRITADALLFCTGYLYDYPFLDNSTGITVVDGKYIRPLHQHFINIEHPSMAFIGVPRPSFPFMVPYIQAQYFRALLEGKIKLPSREVMLKGAELPKGRSVSQAHFLGRTTVLPYCDRLLVAVGDSPLPPLYKYAARVYIDDFTTDPWHFKERNLVIYEDGRVETEPISDASQSNLPM